MLIRVLEIPNSTGNYHFGGGETQPFVEVDWFRDAAELQEMARADSEECPTMTTSRGRELLVGYIKGKHYFDPTKAYLLLAQEHTFTINYSAP